MTNWASFQLPKMSRRNAFTILIQQKFALLVGVIASMSGFLFGLDIGFIGPMVTMDSFLSDFNEGKPLSAVDEGLTVAMYCIGAVVASFPFFSGWVLDQVGRKWSIILAALVFVIGAVIQIVATSLGVYQGGRFVAGFAIGLMSVVCPIYQGEIASKETRGAMITFYPLAVTFGIFIAVAISEAVHDVDNGWQFCVWPQFGVALLMFLSMLFMPRSPRHLVILGKKELAWDILTQIRTGSSHDEIEWEHSMMVAEVESEMCGGAHASWKEMSGGYMLRLTLLGMAAQFLQTFCGMSSFLYYGPKLFSFLEMDSIVFQLVITAINFCVTIPIVLLVDQIGRVLLLRISSVGMTICIWVLAIVGATTIQFPESCEGHQLIAECGHTAGSPEGVVANDISAVITTFVALFVAFFAIGWGPVIWVYCAEIFPTRYRSKGAAVSSFSFWVGNLLVSQLTPILLDNIEFYTYFIYGAFCFFCIWFSFYVPETAGQDLANITPLFEEKFGLHLTNHSNISKEAKKVIKEQDAKRKYMIRESLAQPFESTGRPSVEMRGQEPRKSATLNTSVLSFSGRNSGGTLMVPAQRNSLTVSMESSHRGRSPATKMSTPTTKESSSKRSSIGRSPAPSPTPRRSLVFPRDLAHIKGEQNNLEVKGTPRREASVPPEYERKVSSDEVFQFPSPGNESPRPSDVIFIENPSGKSSRSSIKPTESVESFAKPVSAKKLMLSRSGSF
jgi:SP family sugar:H+ symporter-like MFS transporter